jgi:glycosyltransferase involved in cell wall biosynthesis
VGPVADAHKWALYEQAQIFVLPSYSENFGNVVAEAMAMGCPVAVTPEVGIAPLVAAAGAGIVTSGASNELAAALRELLGDPQRRSEMGVCGVRATRDRLSWSAVAAQAEELYRELLKGNVQSAAVEPA